MRRLVLAAALAVVGCGIYGVARYVLNQQIAESERVAKEDAEARTLELEIHNVQQAALQEIFDAEDEARKQTHAREALSLKISRGEYDDKETLDKLNANCEEWQKAIDDRLKMKIDAIKARATQKMSQLQATAQH